MSSSQPVKKGKDSDTSRSTTSVSVTFPRPLFPPSQQRPLRFSRSAMTGSGKSSGGRATVAASYPPARTDMQRRDSSRLPPRQGVAIRFGVESNTPTHPPSRSQTRTATRVFAVTEDEARVRLGAVTAPAAEQTETPPHPSPPPLPTSIPAMPLKANQALATFFTTIANQAQAGQALPTVPPTALSVPPPPPSVPPPMLDVSNSKKFKEARQHDLMGAIGTPDPSNPLPC
ncbi:PREDICTED: lysine-rich arabinogalactan protein 19-like [Theobroma cacao]|uniref:Lysine-rich arabinogalactan protein 19-like n=1 Tax=Theobroma cacao TaxID=3641 RepID=A0AB32WPP9_THECC|nr:PREDICTED: lysine-rich arabinogalactan protein 19-like [Theobroma cacao]